MSNPFECDSEGAGGPSRVDPEAPEERWAIPAEESGGICGIGQPRQTAKWRPRLGNNQRSESGSSIREALAIEGTQKSLPPLLK